MATTLKVLNEAGETLAEQQIPDLKPGKRMSIWAANAQRKLDKMIAEHPYEAHRALIVGPRVTDRFIVKKGRWSSYVAEFPEDAALKEELAKLESLTNGTDAQLRRIGELRGALGLLVAARRQPEIDDLRLMCGGNPE